MYEDDREATVHRGPPAPPAPPRHAELLSWLLLLLLAVALVGLVVLVGGCSTPAPPPDVDAAPLPKCAELAGCEPPALDCDEAGRCDCYAPRPSPAPLRCEL